MDDSAFPLAVADRAFAYDGSFRTPDALSSADRAAYGLHRSYACESSFVFRAALYRASADPRPGSAIIARGIPNAPNARSSRPLPPVRTGLPQRDADFVAARTARAPIRVHGPIRRASLPYALIVSAAGCTVRAIVWRGRIYCGGVRTCPISIP